MESCASGNSLLLKLFYIENFLIEIESFYPKISDRLAV